MPVLNIPNIGPVSFPDTMPGEEIQSKARQLAQLAAEKFAYKPDYREQGLGALAKAGFGRAAAQLGTTVTDILPAMVASGLGFKDYAKQKMEDAAKAQESIEADYPTAFRSYKEIRGVGDVPSYVAETLGELGPDMLAMLTGAGVTGAIGKRVAVGGLERLIAERAATTAAERGYAADAAKAYAESLKERGMAQLAPAAQARGAQLGADVGVYGSSLLLNAPDTFQNIYDKTGNLSPGIGLAFGAAQAVLDSVLPSRILAKFSPAARAKAANEIIQQSTIIPPTIKAGLAKELAKTTAIEGATEGAQEILGIMAEHAAGATGEAFSTENIDRFLDASLKGAVGGGVFGIPGGVSQARHARNVAMQEQARRAAEGMPPEAVPPAPEGIAQILQPPTPPIQAAPPVPAAPAAPVAPPAPAETPTTQAWSNDMLQQTLAMQLAKPQPVQNTALIEAIRAELARRGAPETAPAPQGVQNVQAPPAVGEPPSAPAGEGVSVPVRPAGGEPAAGVTPPQPSGVVRSERPAQPAAVGEGAQSSTVRQLALEEQKTAGWDPNWPFIPADLHMADFRELILNDSELTAETKRRIFEAGYKLGVVPKDELLTLTSAIAPAVSGAGEGKPTPPVAGTPAAPTPAPTPPSSVSLTDIKYTEPPKEEGVSWTPEVSARSGDLTLNATGMSQYAEFDTPVQTDGTLKIDAVTAKQDGINMTVTAPKGGKAVLSIDDKYIELSSKTGSGFLRMSKDGQGDVDAFRKILGNAAVDAFLNAKTNVKETVASVLVGRDLGPQFQAIATAFLNKYSAAASAPAAPAIAPAVSGAGKRARPSTVASKEPTLEELKAQWSAAAAAKDFEATRRINDQIVALKKKLAGETPAAAAQVQGAPSATTPTEVTPSVPATPAVAPKAAKPAVAGVTKKVAAAPNLTGAEKVFEQISREGFQKNKGITVTDTDTQKVSDLNSKSKEFTLSKGPGLTSLETAARAYFSKVPNVQDALDMIGYDLANESGRTRRSPAEMAEAKIEPKSGKYEAGFMQGMSYKNALLADKWVRENLSPKANAELANFRRAYAKERIAGEKTDKKRYIQESRATALDESLQIAAEERELAARKELTKEQRRKRAEELEAVDPYAAYDDMEDVSNVEHLIYRADAASNLTSGVHPVVRHALYHGDMRQALQFLISHENPDIAKTARAFLDAGVNPAVKVQHELVDNTGIRVPGYYDPRTDTVYLDDVRGMNHHVVFHELGHSALSHTLDNPSHPVTRQMQNLFNDVKGSLDSAYGAQNLQEFAAESLGNPEFKEKLNSINPMGGEITAWQRFSNIVGNFFRRLFGMPPKSIESAQDKVDKLIAAIMSPAPKYRDAELMFAATLNPRGTIAHRALEAVSSGMEKLPLMNQARADKVDQVIRNVFGRTARNLTFSVLPMHAFAEVSNKHLPGFANTANNLIKLRNGDEASRNEKITPVVRSVEEWAKKNPTHIDAFNDVVYGSTTAKVDPTKPRQYYEDLTKDDAILQVNTLSAYDKLRKKMLSIPGGERMYVLMRNAYAAMYKEVKEALGARIDSAIQDPKTRAEVKNEIFRKLAENGGIDPYFPLTRNGDHWLAYSLKDETGQVEYYVRAFESERERARVRSEVESAGATDVTQFEKMSALSYKNVPPTSFVHNTLKLMELNRPRDAVEAAKYDNAMEQIIRLYLSTLPETSFAKAFNRRENVEGYNRDALRALKEKSFSMSRQLSNMKYAAKLNEVRDKAQEYVYRMGRGEGAPDNALAKQYFDELDRRISYAISPTTTNQLSRVVAAGGFNYLLGFNLSSAVVNTMDIPMVVFPFLGGKYGWGNAGKAISNAGRIFMDSGFGTGFSRKVEVIGTEGEKVAKHAMPSLDNFDFEDPKLHPSIKRYATLARVAKDLGMLSRSHVDDALDIDGGKSALNTVNRLSGAALHYGERMSRQVTLMATYNLELQSLEKTKPEMSAKEREEIAANHAVYVTELMNGGTGAAAAAPISKSSLGKVLFMFKSFGVSRNYLMYKLLRDMSKDQPDAVRKAAFYQFSGILGTSALFSGIQGMPFFGVAAMLYNLFKDDDDEDFGTVMHSMSGTMAYKGIVNYLTGLTVAERIGLSNMIFRDDPFSAGSASMADTFASLFGGPIYGVGSRINRGLQLMQEGHTERAIESMLPVWVANPMKAVRYATEGANTLRGDPITGDLSPWAVGAQFFGFAPAEYTRQLEENAMLKGIEKAVTQKQTKLLQRLYISNHVGDMDGYQDAYQELADLFAKHPALGNVNTVVKNSFAQQQKISQEKYHGITINKKLKPELLGLAAELQD